jgi:hypothetical protein
MLVLSVAAAIILADKEGMYIDPARLPCFVLATSAPGVLLKWQTVSNLLFIDICGCFKYTSLIFN